jgi:hypothetical protein
MTFAPLAPFRGLDGGVCTTSFSPLTISTFGDDTSDASGSISWECNILIHCN